MPRPFRLAGIIAGLVLVAFGIGAVVMGISGRHEVSTDIKREQIVGTPDMKPSLIAVAIKEAGLKDVTVPTCDVAGKAITNGSQAKCFAGYMRIHALEATGGKTYAQMPQYATADGKGTDIAAQAVKDPKTGQPQSNAARQVWISETALTTALNTSFFASSVGLFAIIMGIALLLSGIGFIVLAAGLLGPEGLRRRHEGVPPLATKPAPV
jgi:small-conductance mechanosensitive channel